MNESLKHSFNQFVKKNNNGVMVFQLHSGAETPLQ